MSNQTLRIEQLQGSEVVDGQSVDYDLSPLTAEHGVYDESNVRLDSKLQGMQTTIGQKSDKTYVDGKVSEIQTELSNCVKTTAQTLTTAQKTQARTNIGAASTDQIPTDYVSYSEEQDLTEDQKDIARENIEAASQLVVSSITTDLQKVDLRSAQSYTDAQKTQARTNIGAASSAELGEISSEITDLQTNKASKTELVSAKELLFRDLWNDACKKDNDVYGKYNAETGFYECNGITDITYQEALSIYNESALLKLGGGGGNKVTKRTLLPLFLVTGNQAYSFAGAFYSSNYIEVLRLISDSYVNSNLYASSMNTAFSYCGRLKRIIGSFRVSATTAWTNTFQGCTALEHVYIRSLRVNLSFQWCPNLEADSVAYIVNNANTDTITITLHATAYARAMADASVQAALAAHTNVSLASA